MKNRQTRKIKYWWAALTSALAALIISYSFLWIKMLYDPKENTGSDFITYYTVGVIANRYGLSHVYDLHLEKMVEEEIVGFEVADANVLPHNHIPLINPILALLVSLVNSRYLLGLCAWAVVLLSIYSLAIRVLLRIRSDLIKTDSVTMISFLLFFPLFVSLMNGQDTVLLVLGGVLLLKGALKRNDWIAGLGLALMTVRPQIALMLALPFLFTRRRIWWRFFIIALIFVAISVIPLGSAGLRDFFYIMSKTVVGSRDAAMFNVIGLLSRSLPWVSPLVIQILGWTTYLFGVVGVCVLCVKHKKSDERILGLEIVLSLLVSPHLVYHDLTLLVIPLAIGIWKATEARLLFPKDAALIMAITSILLLLSFVQVPTQYIAIYILMCILLAYLWQPVRINHWLETKIMPGRSALRE
jgi:hypothetical protein